MNEITIGCFSLEIGQVSVITLGYKGLVFEGSALRPFEIGTK